MTSTRNINQQIEYNIEKNNNNKIFNSRTDTYTINKAGTFNLGSNPSKFTMNEMANNSVDVESMLRGIKSNNLEGKSFKVSSSNKDMKYINLFDRQEKIKFNKPKYNERQLYLS